MMPGKKAQAARSLQHSGATLPTVRHTNHFGEPVVLQYSHKSSNLQVTEELAH